MSKIKKHEFAIEARKEKGMTQGDVADKARMTRASYCNIELGKRVPSVKLAKRIATVLDVDWTKFFENIN